MDTRRAACILLVWLFTVASSGQWASAHADESPLRYDWQTGQVFAYRAKIVVDLPDKVETYQGTIQYTVKSAARRPGPSV